MFYLKKKKKAREETHTKKRMDLSITAKSEVTQATCKCFLGQKVIWHLSLVKKWDQGSKPSASLHLRGAGEGQPPNSQIEFEGQGRPYGNGNMSFFTTRLFTTHSFLKSQRHNSHSFVFVLIRVEILQPIVGCLSKPCFDQEGTLLHFFFFYTKQVL